MFANHRHRPPSALALLMETRALAELGAWTAAMPWLRQGYPTGDGHPVMCLPGFVAPEFTIEPMRNLFRSLGYAAHGWDAGQNLGLKPGLLEKVVSRIEALSDAHGAKVSLVGWSLGGMFARELAKVVPDRVRLVVSLGSPFAGHPKSTNVWRLYEMVAGHKVEERKVPLPIATETYLPEPPPVPTTAIYTKGDGIVPWQACLHGARGRRPDVEDIEVPGSHCGLGVNPAALYAVADRLAQPEGAWRPFERKGWRSYVFPEPEADPHPPGFAPAAAPDAPAKASAPRPKAASNAAARPSTLARKRAQAAPAGARQRHAPRHRA